MPNPTWTPNVTSKNSPTLTLNFADSNLIPVSESNLSISEWHQPYMRDKGLPVTAQLQLWPVRSSNCFKGMGGLKEC